MSKDTPVQLTIDDLSFLFYKVIDQAKTLPYPLVDAIVITTTLIPVDKLPTKYQLVMNEFLKSLSSNALKLASNNPDLLNNIEQFKTNLLGEMLLLHCQKLYPEGWEDEYK